MRDSKLDFFFLFIILIQLTPLLPIRFKKKEEKKEIEIVFFFEIEKEKKETVYRISPILAHARAFLFGATAIQSEALLLVLVVATQDNKKTT